MSSHHLLESQGLNQHCTAHRDRQAQGLNGFNHMILWHTDQQPRWPLSGGNCWALLHKKSGEVSWVMRRGLNGSNMTRDGTDFPFKISSWDLTVCHYCAALFDGSADERAIAVGNRHEKVDKMEVRDTQPLEGQRQRGEREMRRSRASREIIHILRHINLVRGFWK